MTEKYKVPYLLTLLVIYTASAVFWFKKKKSLKRNQQIIFIDQHITLFKKNLFPSFELLLKICHNLIVILHSNIYFFFGIVCSTNPIHINNICSICYQFVLYSPIFFLSLYKIMHSSMPELF